MGLRWMGRLGVDAAEDVDNQSAIVHLESAQEWRGRNLRRDFVTGSADPENLTTHRTGIVNPEPHLRFTMLHLQGQEGSAFRQVDSEGVAEKYCVFMDGDHFVLSIVRFD